MEVDPGERLTAVTTQWKIKSQGIRHKTIAFGMYMPPLLEALGLAEVEHNPKTTG